LLPNVGLHTSTFSFSFDAFEKLFTGQLTGIAAAITDRRNLKILNI
jgi:hypothetical protein